MNATKRLKLQNELASIMQECTDVTDASTDEALTAIRQHAQKALAMINEPTTWSAS